MQKAAKQSWSKREGVNACVCLVGGLYDGLPTVRSENVPCKFLLMNDSSFHDRIGNMA